MTQPSYCYRVFETAHGFCAIAWSHAGIARFQLPATTADATKKNLVRRMPGAVTEMPPAEVAEVIAAAKRYFDGERIDFSSTHLDLSQQSDLFRSIYAAARALDWGSSTTYGALAKQLGYGMEIARTVGQAMAKNPIPLIIPCHRVLAAGGKIGGFSAPGGSTAKLRMLELEGVRIGAPRSAQQQLEF